MNLGNNYSFLCLVFIGGEAKSFTHHVFVTTSGGFHNRCPKGQELLLSGKAVCRKHTACLGEGKPEYTRKF